MDHPPLVSVIMAAHKVEPYIAAAIESIIAQTYSNWELIIVNDNSPDNLGTIAADYAAHDSRISVITHTQNTGQAIARNDAIEKSRGKYLAILDADDISLPYRLEKQVAYLEKNPRLAIVGCFAEIINTKGTVTGKKRKPSPWLEIKFPLLLQTQFIHSAVCMRAEAFRKLGGYDTNFLHAEDYDLWSRMSSAEYELENIPEFLIQFRIQPQSVTSVSSSQLLQERNALNANARNIKPYLVLEDGDLRKLVKLINNVILPTKDIFPSLQNYKRLVTAYIAQNNDREENVYVESLYRDRRRHVLRTKLKSLIGLA